MRFPRRERQHALLPTEIKFAPGNERMVVKNELETIYCVPARIVRGYV